MKELKKITKNVPIHELAYGEWFHEIAKLLLNNYHIETSVGTYRITEIEFYYYSENHQDESTYGYSKKDKKLETRIELHKQKQFKLLTWFFHYSGIDISIGNGTNPGGILIRGIEKIGSPKEIFDGPLKVQLELLNQGVAVNGDKNFELRLVKNKTQSELNVQPNIRKGLGANAIGFKNKEYRFNIQK